MAVDSTIQTLDVDIEVRLTRTWRNNNVSGDSNNGSADGWGKGDQEQKKHRLTWGSYVLNLICHFAPCLHIECHMSEPMPYGTHGTLAPLFLPLPSPLPLSLTRIPHEIIRPAYIVGVHPILQH